MKSRKLKIIVILSFVFLVILAPLIIIYFQFKSIDNINIKLNTIRKDMHYREVINLLGKPKTEKLIESNLLKLSSDLKERYKTVYIVYYEFNTFINRINIFRLFRSIGIVSTKIVLDKKEGKVIDEIERRIGNLEMIRFQPRYR